MTDLLRELRGTFLCVLVLAAAATPLLAQGTTGRIDGTVTDQAGAPIESALVHVVGASFGARTDAKGYYFLNNVPVGMYTLRVEREPYAVAEAPGVRVHADHTRTLDVELMLAAAVSGVQVLNVPEPVAPRDHVTSKTIIDAAAFHDLPITDVRHVVALQAGVVETDDARGVSIRGSEPGEAAVYIDGALIRNGLRGEADLLLGTNAIEEAAVTTGALDAEVGDAQSGVISFVTRVGGPRYQASLRYRTDDVGFDPWRNVGFNRLEASLGGPIRGNLTFFTALILNGQQSLDTEKLRDVQAPVYVTSGIDTVVRQPTMVGDPTSDTLDVAIPRFVQHSGYCDAARNYGVACQGLRVPFTANGSYTWHGKVQHTYGSGSRLSLTGLASRSQERHFPGVHLYNPTSYAGTRLRSSAVILNWTQSLARLTGKALALSANVSYHSDARISGLLARQSELDSRAAFGGFLVKPLDFLVDFNAAHDVQIGRMPGNVTNYTGVKYLDDVQLQCLLAGQASCRDLVPFLDRDDLLPTQPYRLNPYAVEQSTRHPFWTQGLDGIVDLGRETRWQARASLDWQVDRYNQIRVGGEYYRFDTRRYSAGLISPFGINAYHEEPARQAAYLEDRLDLGRLVIVGGLRWDRFDSRAKFPYTPARISSIIVDTLISGSDTVAFEPFDPLNPEANFVEAPAHHAWSPRVQASVPVTERMSVRFSYAHQVQAPDFDVSSGPRTLT